MCLPRVGTWEFLNLLQCLGIGVQVHWHRECSKCAKTLDAYAVGSIVTISWGVSSRTGISRLWRNLSGYRRWAAWAGVITLDVAAVYEHVHLTMGAVSGFLFTLGGGWPTVWGDLDLVSCATG